MVLDGDVSDGHGPNDETDGWSGTGGVRRHQVGRQTQGTVQRALAGHAVHPGTGGQMLGEGILDDLHQTRRRSGRLDLHLVQELDHESAEALVRARDADGGVDLDQHVLGGANVDLETTGLVEGGVDQGQQFLMTNVRPVFFWVTLELLLAQFAMIVAIEQLEHVATILYCFETSLIQKDNNLLLAGFGRFALGIDGGYRRGYFQRDRGGARRGGRTSLLVGKRR